MQGDNVLQSVRASSCWPLLLSLAVATLWHGVLQGNPAFLTLLLLSFRGWQGLSSPFFPHAFLPGAERLGCTRLWPARGSPASPCPWTPVRSPPAPGHLYLTYSSKICRSHCADTAESRAAASGNFLLMEEHSGLGSSESSVEHCNLFVKKVTP